MQGQQDQNITNQSEGDEETNAPSDEFDELEPIDDIQMEDIDKSPKTIVESTERTPIKTESSLPSNSNITSSRGRIINHDNERETHNAQNHDLLFSLSKM